MANKKISELPQSTQITSDDFLPLVDSGSLTTKQTSFQTVLNYVTGSTFNSVNVTNIIADEAQITSITGTLSGNVDGNASTVTNGAYLSTENNFTNNNVFTTITASSIDVDTITAREYYTELVTASVLYESGSTKFGNTSDDTHQFTGSIFVDGNVSGSNAEFGNLSGNLDWSYISGAPSFISGNETITLDGDATGSGETSIAIGDITASFIKSGTDGTNLINLTASQISNFTDDVRAQFVAGDNITINGGAISASVAGGLGDVLSGSDTTFTAVNTFDNHYITASVGISASSVIADSVTSSYYRSLYPTVFDSDITTSQAVFTLQANNSSTGKTLSVKKGSTENFYVRYDGIVYSSYSFTVANELTISRANVDGQSTGIWRTSGNKPAHFVANGTSTTPAVRVGTKNNDDSEKIFAVSKDLYDPNNSSEIPVDVFEILGDGTVTLSGSLAKITTSGSNILELQPGGTGSVRFNDSYKFPTGDGTIGQALITDGNGQLSFSTISSGGGSGDALTGSDNTFTATNTFDNFYITASAGITGSDAKFTNLSGNLDWSYVINEPAFLTANQEITLSGDATGTGTTSISVSNITASHVDWSNVANVSNIQNSNLQNSSININGADFELGSTGSIAVGTGDVLSGSENTFLSANTFDNFYITASAGITGSDAKFTSLSGNLDWSYVINEPTFLTANETITLSGDATGTGTTSIAVSNVTASYVDWSNVDNAPSIATTDGTQTIDGEKTFSAVGNKFTGSFSGSHHGDGSSLINISNSSLQNSAININGADFELGSTGSIAVGTGDVLSGSDNTFIATNTFSNFYITASAGITGSDAKFTSLSGNLNWSYIVNEPTFLTENETITLSGDAQGSGTDSIAVSSITASYIDWSNIDNVPSIVTTNELQTISGQKTFTSQNNIYSGSTIAIQEIKELNTASGIALSGNLDISGSLVANIEIPNTITSTSYNVDSQDKGKTLLFSNASTQAITCSSNLDIGFNCTFVQMGDGQLILTGSSGVTLLNRQQHTGSAGKYAAISVICVATNQYLIAGDTQ